MAVVPSLRRGTNCRAWLYKILLFTHSAQNRKRARQPFLVDLDAAGETALLVDAPTPDTLTAEAVKAAFDRLPETFRTLVVLVDVEGLTYREAAAALDVPVGTVMSRLSRGRGLLRQDLARHVPHRQAECQAKWTSRHSGGRGREPGLSARTGSDGLVSLRGALGRDQPWRPAPRGRVPRLRGGTGAPAAVARVAVRNLDAAVDADRARARITHAMDRERHSWVRVARLGAVAATLVAAVAVATGRAARRPPPMTTRPRITSPVRSPTRTRPVHDKLRAAQNLESPFEQIVDAVGLSHGPYHVIDAHMCPYKGRNYAHVVIRGDGQTLSLFAERAGRGALPTLRRPCWPETRSTFMRRRDRGIGFRRWRRATTGFFSSPNGRPTRPTSRRASFVRQCVSFAVSRTK